MSFLFTREAMDKFYELYSSQEGSTLYSFVQKAQEHFNMDQNMATIIWQCFDTAIDKSFDLIRKNIHEQEEALSKYMLAWYQPTETYNRKRLFHLCLPDGKETLCGKKISQLWMLWDRTTRDHITCKKCEKLGA